MPPAISPKTARRIALGTLAIYWLALFAGTHLPGTTSLGFSVSDKLLHFVAYAGLGFLAVMAVGAMGRLRWSLLPLIFLGLAAFAAFDELTQPLVSRTADWLDWYADVAGAAVGIACGAVVARLLGWLEKKE